MRFAKLLEHAAGDERGALALDDHLGGDTLDGRSERLARVGAARFAIAEHEAGLVARALFEHAVAALLEEP